jgi:glycosyltransferase 2 family protein
MQVVSPIMPADLAGYLARFGHAVSEFEDALAGIGWGYLAIGLGLSLALQLARAHAWANALRAAYTEERVPEIRVAGAFLVGAGLNGILPARGGDAVKIVLAKRSIEGSTYPSIISSFGVLAPFDFVLGVVVLIYAFTQGLLPQPPQIPDLPAFDVSFWAAHIQLTLIVLAVIVAIVTVLLGVYGRRVESFWANIKQGLVIFREPRRYLRQVAAWQAVGFCFRFASFWMFLDAFHIGGSAQNVLLVMSVLAISGALPFTPGGVGAQQALLVATLGGASRTAVLAYSVGQQIAMTAWSLLVAFGTLLLVFRVTDWRRLVREGKTARAEAGET